MSTTGNDPETIEQEVPYQSRSKSLWRNRDYMLLIICSYGAVN